MAPQEIHAALRDFLQTEIRSGRLTLTEPESTPFGWWLRNLLHAIGWPLLILLLTPLLLLYLPVFIWQLRSREKHDLEIAPRVSPTHEQKLSRLW
jgi:hypothetical protein